MTQTKGTFQMWHCPCTPVLSAVLGISLAMGGIPSEHGHDNLRLKVDGVTFELVRVPTGTFRMGSDEGDSDEQPVHEVCIDREFYMGRTEVTVGQYTAFCKAQGYIPDAEARRWLDRRRREAALLQPWVEKGFVESDDHPAVCVRWHNAVAFCRWLSDRTGGHIRLPSEAEWEYACRAGSTGPHAGDLRAMAWFSDNAEGTTHPVGTKQPNAWGLCDMHGSVWEWCEDNWHQSYEGAPADGMSWPNAVNHDHVVRGGAWCRNPWVCRSAYRYHGYPDCPSVNFGFRIVRDCPGDCDARTRQVPPCPPSPSR